MVLWALGALVILTILGGVTLQIAIARNGPAVLSAVDRVAGGSRGAEKLALISTGDNPAQKLVVWGPSDRMTNAALRPVLLFAHGGSWRSGDPEDYDFMGRAFVPNGFLVVLSGYRLVKEGAPDGVYPAMLEDTAAAIAWTHENIANYGGDPSRIVVMGHSAGAYNVVMTSQERQWLAERGVEANTLRGVIGLSGPYDFYPFDSDSTIAAFGPASDPKATQVFNHVRADAPPTLLVHGEKDTLVRPRNSRELAQLIETAGGSAKLKIYDDMEHNDPLISLAAPWRNRRDVAQRITEFALEVTAD
ncbi:MAG: alpha/beta hydrolase [Pseudomonadota bacterium]